MAKTKTCPKCGKNLPSDAPVGVCPKCLLAAGLDSFDDEGIEQTEGLSSSDPTAPFTTVQYFGDYELLEEIARGGMGVVYKGRQVSLNRIVALKMILSGELADQADIDRFHNEAQAAANLKHPNIVAIHEVGQHEGRYYFSMDYVEGQNLADVIRAGPLPAQKAAEYLKTIAKAVHFAHQRGTLHRDLKPANVLIDSDDQPHITDFGLAKRVTGDSGLTATGAVLGTPSYMSPEQASGRQADIGPHSDVYSLGAILYELLTGRPPFCAASAVATLRQVTDNLPTAPHKLNHDVPQDLETVCLKCLEKSPHVRYHSARELAEELTRFLNHEPIQARPASAVRKVDTWMRRRPWAITAAASVVVLVLVCISYFQFQQNLLLQFQQSHPQYVRAAGIRMIQLETWTSYFGIGFLVVMAGHLFYREKSLRLKKWVQAFDGTAQLTDPQPVSTTVRIVCGAAGLSVLAYGMFLTVKVIETYVWEGLVRSVHLFAIYPLIWFALWLLVRVGKDYRQAVYGRPSRQIDPEQLGRMRESLLEGDPVEALRIYRKAIPNVGREEAGRFVGQLALKVEAEDPKRYAANQPKLWEIHWRAVGICLVIEAIVVLAIWSMRGSLHPGLIAMGLFGGSLFGAVMVAGARCKKKSRRRLVLFPIAWLGLMIFILGPELFPELKVSYSPFGWPWIGFLSGVFLVLSAYTRRRRVRKQ
jgi:tRNA A-37 threonylcarbamoyl transferase component Bud32